MISMSFNPLPSHTKIDYTECYVKLVLEKFFPGRYENLQISDCPDLKDAIKNVGIEVTTSTAAKDQEAIHLAGQIPFMKCQSQRKVINYLNKNGYKYTKFGLEHPLRSYSWIGLDPPPIDNTFCAEFIEAVKIKLNKLNGKNYEKLDRYDLFVIALLYIEDWMPAKLLDKLLSMSNQAKKYSFIYLLALNGLYVFDIENQKWSLTEIGNKLWGIGDLARSIVEEGENN